jgi:hypothetical protein
LRAEAVELAKKQAAARTAEQDKQAREAMDLAKRLADARAKAQAPLADESVPITLETPDPDRSSAVQLFTPDPDESVPLRKVPADPDGSMPVALLTPDPDAPVDEEALWRAAEERARAAAADQKTMPVPKLEAEDLIRELVGEKVTIKETNTSRIVLQEQMTIDRSIQTARIASSAITTVEKASKPREKESAADALFGKARDAAAPTAIDDEPSDGIVRHIPTVETAPQKRPPPPKVEVADDRPGDRTGEITAARKKHSSVPPENVEPSILIEEAVSTTVTDLAAAHEAVAAAAVAQVPAPKTTDLAGSRADKTVGDIRKDAAIAFSDAEEAFFRQGSEKEKVTSFQVTAPVETFDDLDEDYKPVGFWDRLRGKKDKPEKK